MQKYLYRKYEKLYYFFNNIDYDCMTECVFEILSFETERQKINKNVFQLLLSNINVQFGSFFVKLNIKGFKKHF